jgi:1,4-alpha-glucan branching enzyme
MHIRRCCKHEHACSYAEYFSPETNVDACVYLMLANDLMHELNRDTLSIAEDVSGMPVLGRPVQEGGLGFDYRLGMAIPGASSCGFDRWVRHVSLGMSCERCRNMQVNDVL